jgi:hypothetical protein
MAIAMTKKVMKIGATHKTELLYYCKKKEQTMNARSLAYRYPRKYLSAKQKLAIVQGSNDTKITQRSWLDNFKAKAT